MSKSKPQLSVVIPVRNEAVNIVIMVKMFEAVVEIPHEILVVYDNLKDNTIPPVKKLQKKYANLRLVKNVARRGVANALKTGVAHATSDVILIFATDELGPLIAVDDMLALMQKGCDLVSCTRYAYGGRRLGGSKIGGFLSRLGNRLFQAVTDTKLTDATTGIKMFKKSIVNEIPLTSNVGWAVVFELSMKAQIRGLKLGEVPIISIDRLYGGESTFVVFPWLKEYIKWFWFGIKHIGKYRSQKPLLRIPHGTVV